MAIIGYLMLALLFFGLFAWITKRDGWQVAFWVFLIASIVVGWIHLSVYFITWGK